MVLKKEAPPGKNGKTESIFAVFAADMVKEKERPPVNTLNKKDVFFFGFRFLPFLPRIW